MSKTCSTCHRHSTQFILKILLWCACEKHKNNFENDMHVSTKCQIQCAKKGVHYTCQEGVIRACQNTLQKTCDIIMTESMSVAFYKICFTISFKNLFDIFHNSSLKYKIISKYYKHVVNDKTRTSHKLFVNNMSQSMTREMTPNLTSVIKHIFSLYQNLNGRHKSTNKTPPTTYL